MTTQIKNTVGTTTVLKDLHWKGAVDHYGNGAAVDIWNVFSDVQLTHCLFENVWSLTQGDGYGVVHFAIANVSMSDCQFYNCCSKHHQKSTGTGGGILDLGKGPFHVNVSSCHFEERWSRAPGGIVYIGATPSVTNSMIVEHTTFHDC